MHAPAAKRARTVPDGRGTHAGAGASTDTPHPLYTVFPVTDILPAAVVAALNKELCSMPYRHDMPGGYLTNSPRRGVWTCGDGGALLDDGTVTSRGSYPSSYWTASIKYPHVTLQSKTTPLTPALGKLGATARAHIAAKRFLGDTFVPDDFTFALAVCNQYSDPKHVIAEHTDANPWYPGEHYFLSYTLYPDGEPPAGDYARFQVQHPDRSWEDVRLAHGSCCVMSGRVPHRVLAHKRGQVFRRRINVTLRTMFRPDVNPVMHVMAVANHTRYYGAPVRLIMPADVDVTSDAFAELVSAFRVNVTTVRSTTAERLKLRAEARHKLRRYIARFTTNMVLEMLLQAVEAAEVQK